MLQFAGIAAILNEINPGLGDKIAAKFNGSITTKVSEHLSEPIAKSYKYGMTTGLIVGVISGTLITIAAYKMGQRQRQRQQQSKS